MQTISAGVGINLPAGKNYDYNKKHSKMRLPTTGQKWNLKICSTFIGVSNTFALSLIIIAIDSSQGESR